MTPHSTFPHPHTRTHTLTHTLAHALNPAATGCRCDMRDITHCVICERRLPSDRDRVDTCSGACTRSLRNLQRRQQTVQIVQTTRPREAE